MFEGPRRRGGRPPPRARARPPQPRRLRFAGGRVRGPAAIAWRRSPPFSTPSASPASTSSARPSVAWPVWSWPHDVPDSSARSVSSTWVTSSSPRACGRSWTSCARTSPSGRWRRRRTRSRSTCPSGATSGPRASRGTSDNATTGAGSGARAFGRRFRSMGSDEHPADNLDTFLVDVREAVTEVRCPVLVLRGQQSDVLSDEGAVAAVEAIPDARLEVVERAGHLAAGDNPHSTVNAISRFLDEQVTAGA
ncbi:MAG: alpha/beta hydrolase [Acidimicrobiia bacterium]|nr:alpha/beta hydrolase [Acidimicrobiia bacterium]